VLKFEKYTSHFLYPAMSIEALADGLTVMAQGRGKGDALTVVGVSEERISLELMDSDAAVDANGDPGAGHCIRTSLTNLW
jgi:hypothetical protein